MSAPGNVVRLPERMRWDYERVPNGEYNARVVGNDVRTYFRGKPTLALWWRLLEPGYMHIVLPRFYAVPGPSTPKPRKNGYYRAVGRASNLARDLAAMLQERPRVLHGPFPMHRVENHVYRVLVETVTHDREQRELPLAAQYSKVARVISCVQ